ncbi:MAG: hypothetical protein ACOCG6_07745 [Candidatus Cloacimonadaceae bacterium]|jgi:hypothetical protein
MSSKKYDYDDDVIPYLPLGDFERMLKNHKNTSAIYMKIKDDMPEGKGVLEIDYKGRQYKYDNNDWIPFEKEKQVSDKKLRERKLKPSREKYGITFSAADGAKAGKRLFKYKFNLDGVKNDEYFSVLPNEMDLRDLLKCLISDFAICSNDLLNALACLDIGTFNVGVEKKDGRYSLIRLNQLTAPSNRGRDLVKLEDEISKFKDMILRLQDEASVYQITIQELERRNAEIEHLKKIEKQYNLLTKELNIQGNDENIESLKTASRRNDIKKRLSDRIDNIVYQDLRKFGINREGIEKMGKTVLAEMQSYINDTEDNNELDNLVAFSSISDIKDASNGLYSIYVRLLSDVILFHFSNANNRSGISISEKNSALKKYDLELFEIPVGSADTLPKVCRVLSVKDSDYPRGTCLETTSYGMRRISDGSIIYKADVVISS